MSRPEEGDGLAVRSETPRKPQTFKRLHPLSSDESRAAALYVGTLSPGSRRATLWRLEAAARAMGSAGVPAWERLTYPGAVELRGRVAEAHPPATARAIMQAVRGAVRAAWLSGAMDGDTYRRILEVPPIRGESARAGRYFTRGEVAALFEACDGSAIGRRDTALLAVLFGCGLRRSEASALRVADVDLAERRLTVHRGKGGKGRHVPLLGNAAAHVEAWATLREGADGPLLCRVLKGGRITGEPIGGEGIRLRLRTIAARADVPAPRPHDARRTLASALLSAGADPFVIARILGHASVQTTLGYDHRTDLAEAEAAALMRLPPPRSEPGPGGVV